MKYKHPYSPGGPGAITKLVEKLKSNLPSKLDSSVLKKLGVAPNNESYLISIWRFLDLLEDDGSASASATDVFHKSGSAFEDAFAAIVRSAYSDLFEIHGDAAWTLDRDSLIAFFREADKSSQTVGEKQASTFATLATCAGKEPAQAAVTQAKSRSGGRKSTVSNPRARKQDQPKPGTAADSRSLAMPTNELGLTIRIEVNLPSGADAETYDSIFKSIRANFMPDAKP